MPADGWYALYGTAGWRCSEQAGLLYPALSTGLSLLSKTAPFGFTYKRRLSYTSDFVGVPIWP